MSRILALGLFLLVVFSPSHCTARRLSSPALDNDTDDFWRATKFQPLSRTAKIRPESYVISFVPNLAFGVARLKLVNLLENRTLYAEFQPRILYEYTTAAGFGVAVSQLSNDILIEVLNGDFVKSVTPDYELELDRHEMVPANWGLDRIDEDSLPMDGEYHYEHNGAGVNVFILDTGIYREHFDFAAKTEMINQRTVTCGYDAFLEKDRIRDWEDKSTSQDHPEECIDTHGHGTHVTGIVGGLKSGVSKQVNLIAVKVFDTDLGGSLSTVLAGLDYVLKQQETQSSDESKPAIVNLSLSGPFCALLNDAVEALVEIGIVVVVSAGNDGSSSCSKSPGSSNKVITVSATDSNDNMVAYSNFGLCTNIFAPGHQIASSWIRHDHDVVRLSGTSLAAPHVTGVAAQYAQLYPEWTPGEIAAALEVNAVRGVIQNLPVSTANALLNLGDLREQEY